jgi:tetratricopeptide (TPR) repeat protein
MKTMDCIDACPNDALSIGFGENSLGKRTKQRKYDLTISQELGVSVFFLVGFFSFRGLYGVVPMLMAVGMSLVSTWLVWKALQVLTSKNASFHKTQLRFHGKYKIGSVLFLIIALLVFLFTIQSGLVRICRALGNVAMANDESEKALGYYQLAGPMSDGGIGFASNPNIDTVMARIHETKGEFQEAQRLLWRVDDRIGPEEISTMMLGQLLQYDQQTQLIDSFYSERLVENENWELVWEDYVGWLKRDGMYERAISASKGAVARNQVAIRLQIQLALLEVDFGDVQNAIAIATLMTETHPTESTSWKLLARTLDKAGDQVGAREALHRAAELQ